MRKIKTLIKLLLHNRSIIPFIILSNLTRLGLTQWIPDKYYLELQYRLATLKKLNLDNPKTFNEKLQWLKLYDRKPEYTTMVDKYAVKEYVARLIGAEHIIPTYGVWDNFDEIDFDKLPNQFVLKCTHDSGGLIIVRDKSKFDKLDAKSKLNKSLSNNFYYHGREWPYKNVQPRILAEQYMEDGSGDGLKDYKFFCFNGEPKFLYISQGLEDHNTAKMNFLSLDWNLTDFQRSDYRPFDVLPPEPSALGEMTEIATKLSKNLIFIRVDLYEIDGQVCFSELTFFPNSGFVPFQPEEWDYKLGEWIKLPEKMV